VDKKAGQKELSQANGKEFLANQTIKDSPNLASSVCQLRDYFKKNCVYRGV
jgi:hypothetical protein